MKKEIEDWSAFNVEKQRRIPFYCNENALIFQNYSPKFLNYQKALTLKTLESLQILSKLPMLHVIIYLAMFKYSKLFTFFSLSLKQHAKITVIIHRFICFPGRLPVNPI